MTKQKFWISSTGTLPTLSPRDCVIQHGDDIETSSMDLASDEDSHIVSDEEEPASDNSFR